MVAGHAFSDPVNSYQPLSYLITGIHYEDGFEDANFNTLYGDYFGAALDATDSSRIWVAGEYNTLPNGHQTPTWSTFIGSINVISSGCTPPSSGVWTVTSSCTMSSSAIAPANVIVQPGVVLTIKSGVTLTVHFGTNHLLVQPGGMVIILTGGKLSS
jgi:hypothetical protein